MSESFTVYALKRVAFGAVVFFLMLTLVFFLMRILPGDPITNMWPEETPLEEIIEMRRRFGLDKPIFTQYVDYMVGLFKGDFGVSYLDGNSVLWHIGERYKVTIELMIGAWLLSAALGIPLGMLSALKHGSKIDHGIKIIQIGANSKMSEKLLEFFPISLKFEH